MKTGKSERSAYWDAAKAILIYLVVAGHCIQYGTGGDFWSNPAFRGIYIFHMPLFMMIGGYFGIRSINKRGWHAVPRYAKRLLPPILTILLLKVVYWVGWSHLPLEQLTATNLGALWFLVVILECCIFAAAMATFRNILWRIAWSVLPILLAILWPEFIPYSDYLTTMWPCYLLGAALSSRGFTERHIGGWWWISLPTAAAAIYFFHDSWYMYLTPLRADTSTLYAWLARLACAACSGAAFLGVIKLCKAERLSILASIGAHTMALYVLQALFFKAICLLGITPAMHTALACLCGLVITAALYGIYLSTRKIKFIAYLLYGE